MGAKNVGLPRGRFRPVSVLGIESSIREEKAEKENQKTNWGGRRKKKIHWGQMNIWEKKTWI